MMSTGVNIWTPSRAARERALLLENYERLANGATLSGIAPQKGPIGATWGIETAGSYAASNATPHQGSRIGRGTYSGARGGLKITLGTGDFFFQVWLRASNASLNPCLVYRTNGGGMATFLGWSVRFESSEFRIVESAPGWTVRASAAFSFTTGTWYRVWVRVNGSSHEAGVDGGPTISHTSSNYAAQSVIGWGAMGNASGTVDTDLIRVERP